MSHTPRLLDQLVDLTAIRDMELLEFSLLKTLNSFIHPIQIRLLKLDSKLAPVSEIQFISEKCIVNHDDIRIVPEIHDALTHMSSAESEVFYFDCGQEQLTIHELCSSRTTSVYLFIYTQSELSALDKHLVAGMLQIYRNYSRLLADSQTDELTGLANRKTFDDTIGKIYELIIPEEDFPAERRSVLESHQYWIAVIDIDHFKSVNDRFGHLFGDEVLILLAQKLKAAFRENDLIFRFGGEEFVAVIGSPDKERCQTALERLRCSVETHSFPQLDGVTISIGVAQLRREEFHLDTVEHADQALYYSKNSGRNRITFYEDLVEQGLLRREAVQIGEIDLF